MEWRIPIAALGGILVLAACHSPVETHHSTSLHTVASAELSAIDSLMWQRVDNVQIAALLQKSVSTIWEREKRLQKILGSDNRIAIILNNIITN